MLRYKRKTFQVSSCGNHMFWVYEIAPYTDTTRKSGKNIYISSTKTYIYQFKFYVHVVH